MKRVLQIMTSLSKGGGCENLIMNYYRAIDRDKIQFDFIYFKESDDSFKEEIIKMGGRVYKFDFPDLTFNYKNQAVEFFKKNKDKYIAVHCHALFAVALYGPIAKKNGIEKIIAHSHASEYGAGIFRIIRNYYFVKSAKYIANYYLADSEEAAEFMFGKKNVNLNKVRILPCSIDVDSYKFIKEKRDKLRKELNISSETVVLGHVGGFDLSKNHKFLMDVFLEFNKYVPNSNLVLIGGERDGNSAFIVNSLKEKAVNNNVSEKVKFLGVRSDVNELLMAMDIFLFPSTNEGFGMSLIEAQASGLLCFASNYIPLETKCTDTVEYLDLNLGAEEWAKLIYEEFSRRQSILYNRMANRENFSKYNIKTQAEILPCYYLE